MTTIISVEEPIDMNIDSGAFAVVWGGEHFNIYTEEAACTVITDRKLLLHIWQKPNLPL